jgi:hypothetical protein
MPTDIAEDIKLAYIEVGTSYDVLRNNALVGSGEYLIYDLNAQATKPFIRENFLEASLPYDTSGEAGDVLCFRDGSHYMLMNKTAFELENQPLEYSSVLYKANVSGELLRPSGEDWNTQTYHKQQVFNVVRTNCYALLTESLFRYELSEQDFGQLTISKDELYIPKCYGIQVHDRYCPVSGEYYKVSTVKTRGFPGVEVVSLEEDTR